MADQVRTEQELLTLYANNNTGDIDAQDLRDFVVTHFSHVKKTNNPHSVTATQVGALVSVDGVSAVGGNIDLVAGTGISIIPNNSNKTITISNTVSNVDEKTKVSLNDSTPGFLNGKLVAGDNISFTENNDGANETLTISAASGVATINDLTDVSISGVTDNELLIYDSGNWINQTFEEVDIATNTDLQDHISNISNPHSVTASQVGALVSVNSVANAGGNIDLVAGTGISITPNDGSNTITIESTVIGGEISEIALDQIIDVTITDVSNGELLVHSNGDWINQTLIEADIAANSDLQSHTSNTSNPHSVTASQVGALVSVNSVANAGGNIDLVAGSGISITSDDGSNTITIESTIIGGISEISLDDISDVTITNVINGEILIRSNGDWINQTLTEADIATDTDLQDHISNISNPHSVTASQVGALVSVNSVANAGGNIDLVAGTGISITPDDGNNTITIESTVVGGGISEIVINDITDVTITDVADGEILVYSSGDWINRTLTEADIATSTDLQSHTSNTNNPHSVTASQVGALVSVNSVANAGGNIDLVAGEGISITPDDGSNTITIESTIIGGISEISLDDISDVTITNVTNGEILIHSNGDWINQTLAESDIATDTDLQSHTSNTSNPHSVTASQVGALVSVNSVANAGGNIDLVAGTGISITPDDGSNTITIESTVVGGGISEISLDDVTDVTITNAINGELLIYDNGNWINQTFEEVDIATDADLQDHISNISNPHSVTASQVGALVSVNSVANAGGNIDLVAGEGISITPDDGSNTITIESTVVGGGGISEILEDTSPQLGGNLDTNEFTITTVSNRNLILEPNGTGAFVASSSGNARGNYSVDLQRDRANVVEVASGTNATISGGANNQASASYTTIPGGFGAKASHYGEFALASGSFSTTGDAQVGILVARRETSDDSITELTLDGNAADSTNRITLDANDCYGFTILVIGRCTTGDSTGSNAVYKFDGAIERTSTSTSLVGNVMKTIIAEDVEAWNASVVADDTNDSIGIMVTGEASNTIRWVAKIDLVKVNG